MTGTANPAEAQPYAPSGMANLGKAPVNGTGGERGTSAFAGNSEYDANGVVKATTTVPTEGPKRGIDYYKEAYGNQVVPTGRHNGSEVGSREPANKPAPAPAPTV